MPTILSTDFPLHVRTDGDDRRPALLLLNPLGTTLEVWDPMIERLKAHNFVIRFDQRGHGLSVGAVGSIELPDLAADAVAVLDALDVDRAHVFGASLGAMIGLWLAAEYPDRVNRLVLASTSTRLGPDHWWQRTIDTVEEQGLEAIADHLETIFFSEVCRSKASEICRSAREMLLRTPTDAYLAGARAILHADLRSTAPRVQASTLLIFSEDDPVLRHIPALDLLGLIRDSEAVQVGSAAHRVILEQPDAIATVVDEFLSDPDGH